MKKYLIATGVATVAFATIALAQGYTFNTNLTVGSTGADVTALQTWLIANGYSIPAISSGAADKGYFGSQTQAAVELYQAAKGIPNTGFVGPLTRAALNGGTSMTMATCPAGYTCTATAPAPVISCPVGYTCQANPGTTPVVGTITGITTPGVAGSLDVSNGSFVGNGTTVNDGQSVGIASFALQSGASDMQVSSVAVDFSVRPWLYMTSLTLTDTNGNVLGTVTGLSQANFTEITVGSDYRINIPTNFVIPKATRYIAVLNGQFATSNRAMVNIYVIQAQTRSVDGTGVTLTSTYGNQTTSNPGLFVAYNGEQSSSIVATIDSSSPYQGIIQTNSGNTQTPNVKLAVYDLKSQNVNSTLQSLTIGISTKGNTPANTFANVQLYSGSTLLSSGSMTTVDASTSNVTFSNFNLALPSNQYIPITIEATVQGGVTNTTASTSLLINATDIGGIDSSSNPLTVNSSGSTISSSIQSLVLSGGALSNLNFAIATPSSNNTGILKTTTFSGSFTITGGNNPIYISRNASTAFATSTNAVGATSTMTNFVPSDGVQSTDSNASFYTINPGATRTFTFNGTLINGTGATASIGTGITTVYLTDDTTNAVKLPINFLLSGLNSDYHIQVLMGTN